MLNHIILMGRLTRDPELKQSTSGTAVCTFHLAVDRDFKDKSTGERVTDFVSCVAWRHTAEFASRYFAKGRMAVVEGRLQMEDWTDKDGSKRITAKVIVSSMYFADSKLEDGKTGQSSQTATKVPPPQSSAPQQFSEITGEEEALPF